MKKTLSLAVGLMCICSLLLAVKIAELPEITKYPRLFVDKDHFYIIDDNTLKIHIYSKKGVKHIKDFSKGGEGPGEFKFAPELVVYPDYLFLMERGKVCCFSKTGILMSEVKVPHFYTKLIKVNDHFAAKKRDKSVNPLKEGKVKHAIVVLDANFKEIETIHEIVRDVSFMFKKSSKQDYHMIDDHHEFFVLEDKIIVGNTQKGFYFAVFDHNGRKLHEIDKKYEKQPITEKVKEMMLDDLKKRQGDRWAQFKEKYRVIFTKYFPAYKSFTVNNGLIYVFTHSKEKGRNETLVLDLNGNIVKKTFLPPGETSVVYGGKYYYIVENADKEIWELHSEVID